MKKDFIDKTFDGCVTILERVAKKTGLTYKQLNVIIFCAVLPAFTIYLGYKAFKK